MLFKISGYHLKLLQSEDDAILQAMLEKCADYSLLVTGSPPGPTAAPDIAHFERLGRVCAQTQGARIGQNPEEQRPLESERPDRIVRVHAEGVDVAERPAFADLEEKGKQHGEHAGESGKVMDGFGVHHDVLITAENAKNAEFLR